jgi:hypothetical protein
MELLERLLFDLKEFELAGHAVAMCSEEAKSNE